MLLLCRVPPWAMEPVAQHIKTESMESTAVTVKTSQLRTSSQFSKLYDLLNFNSDLFIQLSLKVDQLSINTVIHLMTNILTVVTLILVISAVSTADPEPPVYDYSYYVAFDDTFVINGSNF